LRHVFFVQPGYQELAKDLIGTRDEYSNSDAYVIRVVPSFRGNIAALVEEYLLAYKKKKKFLTESEEDEDYSKPVSI
jgi:hypothetical protein